MTVLILNKKDLASHPYQEWLGEAGPLVLLNEAGASAAAAGPWLGCEEFDDYKRNGALELRAVRLGREHRAARVVSLSECDVVRSARVRRALGLPGQRVESALAFRNKYQMKAHAAAAGIPVPRFQQIDNVWDVYDFAEVIDGPIVVKPVSGAGSLGVHLLHDRGEAARWAAALPPSSDEPWNLLAEEFVDAPMFHVNGVMAGGKVHFAWSSGYVQPCLEALRGGRPQTGVMLAPESRVSRCLEDATSAVVAALPAVEEPTSFHAEFFVTGDDQALLCEIAARTGGGGINDVARLAFGVDLERCSARGQAGLAVELPALGSLPDDLFGYLILPPRPGILTSIPDSCPLPGVVDYRTSLRPGESAQGPAKASSAAALAMVRGSTPEQQTERLLAVERWFYREASWRQPGSDTARRNEKDLPR